MKKYALLLGALGVVLIAFAFTTNTKQNDQGDKITICHFPAGNKTNGHEITISKKEWPTHQSHHGDYEKTPYGSRGCPCLEEQQPQ
ncbi:hypothetical protein FEDK69T_12940 [Flavobacterium enshiense DK69]|uniref:Secreted protein n=1 Tax=Flavobacterium enshiense DK69 TaxID=1107311 RepID=V6S908_9FLAO|nr:hypothetical protein [Flavobacterium enshiense]ESU23143.1 hypothetical protein FEDK69T_12940 [Flavobacterium enshiense DK69]KGO95996.1 hypothetical protein Q767_06945 [Flavobacterium enshiense DK69]